MKTAKPDSSLHAALLRLLDEAYSRQSWHGPTLKGAIRGLVPEQAAWRPAPQRRSIAEIVLHAAYWKYTVRRRLTGEKRGSFPLKGSNWFPLPDPFDARAWREIGALLDAEHRLLHEAVAAVPPEQLAITPTGSKVSNERLIRGICLHDVYHAGQIQTLKALYRSR